MAEVIINVGANTQAASAQVNQLNQALGKTGAAADAATQEAEQLGATLKKQESTIKIIDGAVNLLGGSVELLAGSLVLSGAATKEQAEEFERIALGAIAFADGAKRTVDGLKNLNEGLALSGGLTKTLNTALLANPAAITAAAIVGLGVAIGGLIFYLNQADTDFEEVNDALFENIKLSKEQIGGIGKQVSELKLLQSVIADTTQSEKTRNAALVELKKTLPGLEGIDLKRADAINKISQAIANEIIAIEQRAKAQAVQNKLTEFYTRQLEIVAEVQAEFAKNGKQINEFEARFALQRQDQVGVTGTLANEFQKLNTRIDESTASLSTYADIIVNKSTPATKADSEAFKAATVNVLNYKDAVDKRNQAIKEGIELFIEDALGGAEVTPPPILPQLPPDPLPALEKSALSFSDYLQKLNNDLNEFFEGSAGKAVGASLSTAANLAKTLAESQDESSEKAFNASKKYKIAAVVTSAIQSSFEAFGAAQQFGPILGPILGIAQVAAIAIASNKAIADIKSSTFTAPGSVSTPSSGGSSGAAALAVNPAFNAGGFLGQPQGTLTPITSPQTPLRAYVVSADVTNGQQANAQIQRRRVLGPG